MDELQKLESEAKDLKGKIDAMGDDVKPGYQGAYEGLLGSIDALKAIIKIKTDQVPGYHTETPDQAE